MPVTLITGPLNAGKSTRALEMLTANAPGDRSLLITPDRMTAATLRRTLQNRNTTTMTALRSNAIQGWDDFVRHLARPLLPVASRQQSTLLLLKLLPHLPLTTLSKPTRSYALARHMIAAIIRLKQNLIQPQELRRLLAEEGDARHRERDLATAYEAYEQELTRTRLLDEGDLFLLALEQTLKLRDSTCAWDLLVFDEFLFPTPQHLAFVRALAQARPKTQIVVTVPSVSDPQAPFVAFLQHSRDLWSSIAEDEELLSASSVTSPHVELVRTATPAQEARYVARLIHDQALDASDTVVAVSEHDSFLEWYLSEAHSLELLPEHPTLDGARGSPVIHELLSSNSIEQLPREAPLVTFVEAIRKQGNASARVHQWTKRLHERRGRGRVAARSLSAVALLSQTLRQLETTAHLLGSQSLTREQAVSIITDELLGLSASATMIDAVLPFRRHALGSPLAVACTNLIIPRLLEGHFPSTRAEAIFFSEWNDPTIRRIFLSPEDRHACEAYAFESMLAKCRERATFVIPACDDSGSETTLSAFTDRFRAASPESGLVPSILVDRETRTHSDATIERLVTVENARIDGDLPHHSPLAAYLGQITDPPARALIRKRFTENELSASALERYANCPFSFFMHDVLRAEEVLEPTPQIQGRDRGRLVHDILRSFYQDHGALALQARHDATTAALITEIVHTISQRIWQEQERQLSYVSHALRERECRESAEMALAVIKTEIDEATHVSDPLTPAAFEWAFSREHDTSLAIPVPNDEPLLVRGRVDRVDIDAEARHLLVIDYKSGDTKPVINPIAEGKHLQLPLYIEAVHRFLYPDAEPLGALMVEIKQSGPTGDPKKTEGKTKGLVLKAFNNACYRVGRAKSMVDDEELHELIDVALTFAASSAIKIRNGNFSASREADCQHCDYGDTCRYHNASPHGGAT